MERSHGFSLIELAIALVIAGTVLAFGLPAFGHFRNSLAIDQENAQLTQDMRRARQLAVTRRAPVIVCFGVAPATTNITRYTFHVDSNGDNLVQSNEMVTARQLPGGTRLDDVALSPTDSLVFDISGVLRPGSSGGMLTFSNADGRRDTLCVSAAGICYRP